MTFCKKWWWTNILYISNLYPCQFWELHSSNPDNDWGDKDYAQCSNGDGELGCMIQTWYLSNDFQMFVAVVPCALLFKWKVWACVQFCSAGGCLWWGYANMSEHFMTMCDMMICGHSYGRRLLDVDLTDQPWMHCLRMRTVAFRAMVRRSFFVKTAKSDVQVYYYDKPWARYPPYGVGVMLAIMLMHTRREPGVAPNEVKFLPNGIPDVNNKIAKPPKMHPITVGLGWVAALGVLFYCSFGPYYAIPVRPPLQRSSQLWGHGVIVSVKSLAMLCRRMKPHDCPWGGNYTQAPEMRMGTQLAGTRTHSFWDLTFSTCFRMWCVAIPSLMIRSQLCA